MRDYLEELLEALQEDRDGDVAGELLASAARAAGSARSGGPQAENQGRENRNRGPSSEQTEGIRRPGPAETAAFAAETAREADAPGRQRTDRSKEDTAEREAVLRAQEAVGRAEYHQVPFQNQETVRRRQAEQAEQAAQEAGAAGGLQEERGLEVLLPARLQAGRVSAAQRAGTLKDQLDQAQRANAYRAVPEGRRTEERGAGGFFAERAAAAPAVEARQVDRVFERDARRYDCGFTLF